ncbi:Fatty acid desaturase [Amycolatopsis xylanica]|uniref:Fatty acid desaturase n=1 Tax=Amycolatopsis xylanica TaxID=589385 RepID=A0A1H3IPZ5_9PSEU|nr:Fatty acid desaturase [Amycolatopsis xylanica]
MWGVTTNEVLSPPGSDFARLTRRVSEADLLRRRPGYYIARFSLVIGLFAAGWTGFAFLGDSWWSLGIAVFFAVMFAQIAFLSHDLAHRQVFRTRRPTEIAGWAMGNFGIGMSYGWWMDKHTRHHANPNHDELDPDVDPDVLVWSKKQAKAARGVPAFIGRYQAFLFFPLLTLEGFNLHVSGFRALFSKSLKHKWIEGSLLTAHVVLYLAAVFTVLSPGKAVLFVLVHQCLWGVYMGSVFAPSHKGMPILSGKTELDFLRKQVLTSRNILGGRHVDIAMGGLNYQIEHHLFPSMPAPHLAQAQRIVEDYCAELGIPYSKTTLLNSYSLVLRSLHEAGEPLRNRS